MSVTFCVQRTPKSKHMNEHVDDKRVKFKSGLTIENGINRGTGYTDSLGTDYNIRYIPITITNDSTISVQLQINFSKEYSNPLASSNHDFNIISMEREWAVNGGKITDSMFIELIADIKYPLVKKILKPGEEFLLGIGTRYHRATGYVAPLPEVLFVQGDRDSFQLCDSLLFGERIESNVALGLKLIFNRGQSNERCAIVPCGHISYFEN
jgi:hypothetical protein